MGGSAAERLNIDKRIIIIAGPNGAGLSPFAPELVARRAARLMLEEIDRCVGDGISFAFETTLAGKGYAHRIVRWQALGYSVKLVFLPLQTVDQALARVGQRVSQGGHAITPQVVARRFRAGLHNVQTPYRPLVNEWQTIDNGGPVPHLLSEGGQP